MHIHTSVFPAEEMEITVGSQFIVEVLRLDLHSIQCRANTKCCLGSIINTL